MNITALREYLVMENGNVNFPKSLGKLEADLLEYQRITKINSSLVCRGIDMVFDKYPGSSIGMEALTNLSMMELKATPDQYAGLVPALQEYVRSNVGDSPSYKFGKTNGRGFWRWKDKNLNTNV